MNIALVNNYDLMNRNFNGFEWMPYWKNQGHLASMLVPNKQSNNPDVFTLGGGDDLSLKAENDRFESLIGTNNLFNHLALVLKEQSQFIQADIVHYHLIHNKVISILDFPMLTSQKPSVWTIHDFWPLTGGCYYMLGCGGWLHGCAGCKQRHNFTMLNAPEKAAEMYEVKQRVFGQVRADLVVATDWMKTYVKKSPLLGHFEHVHVIPFGLDVEAYQKTSRGEARRRLGIDEGQFVVAFRSSKQPVLKGCDVIFDALERLSQRDGITLLACDDAPLPEAVTKAYPVAEYGWHSDLTDFYAACDVFLMPSMAETFGLMAIEAMAAGRCVVVAEGTVLPEVVHAPEVGMAVPQKDAAALAEAVEHLRQNPAELQRRGDLAADYARQHYAITDCAGRHLALYEEILAREVGHQ